MLHNLSATYTNSSLIPKVYKGQRTPRDTSLSIWTNNKSKHSPKIRRQGSTLAHNAKDFRYPQTSARSECTQTNRILTPQSTNQDKQYLTHIRGGNGSTWMRDFTIDRNHTISCRHWASSTFKFPIYRGNSESTNKDSTLNLPSTLRKYRCKQHYRKGRWTRMLSFQYLSNNTHFYRPTTKLN